MSFDPYSTPPEILFLSLPASDICNYRCRHCHIWLQEERANPLDRSRRVELIREFAAWNPAGTVILPGGEVTLDEEELLAVGAAAREAGLPLILLTNGSRIDGLEISIRLALSGATHVVVSLDGPTRELHDFTRGVAGAFETTVAAIRHLVEARRRVAPSLTVMTACVLFKENLAEFPRFVELCRELGVQHVDTQLLARTFANRNPDRDVFFEKHFWHAPEEKREAKQVLRRIVERYRDDPLVVKKSEDLDWMLAYVDDPDYRTERPICGSHHRNLLVDATGDVSLCFNAAAIFEEPAVGNARHAGLREIWESAAAAEARAFMDRCTLNCGALNCHRRKSPAPAVEATTR